MIKISHEFLHYLIVDALNIFGALINLGVSLWLIFRASETHRLLTNSYIKLDKSIKNRQHTYKPLCIQGARGVMIYGICYAIAIYHWQLTVHWQNIGSAEDIVWLILELISMMTMLQFLMIGKTIIKQNITRRRDDKRCPEESACPVRNQCLTCSEADKK